MNDEIKGLETALSAVRSRLLRADISEPGFGEMRALYNELTDALIKAAHKSDDELATALNAKASEVVQEWESNKASLGSWTSVLKDVVTGVGSVLAIAGIPNPLASLLPA